MTDLLVGHFDLSSFMIGHMMVMFRFSVVTNCYLSLKFVLLSLKDIHYLPLGEQ